MIYKKNCFASFENFIIYYRLWVRNFFDFALTSLPRRRFLGQLAFRPSSQTPAQLRATVLKYTIDTLNMTHKLMVV